MSDANTRLSLIETAERLFAEKGIDNVSLREINRAAGQKNVAALHYHFGTRESLLEAIFEHRMSGVNDHRVGMLTQLEHVANDASVRQIVEALVFPLTAQMESAGGGTNYVRFLSHAISDPNVNVGQLVRNKYDQGMAQTRRIARRMLTHLPGEIVDLRITLAGNYMVHALADEVRRTADTTHVSAFFIANLIDSIVGAISAPASEETLSQFAQVSRIGAKRSTSHEPSKR